MEQSSKQLVVLSYSLIEDARKRMVANAQVTPDVIRDIELGLSNLRSAAVDSKDAQIVLHGCLLRVSTSLLSLAMALRRTGVTNDLQTLDLDRIEGYLLETESLQKTEGVYACFGRLRELQERYSESVAAWRMVTTLDANSVTARNEIARLEVECKIQDESKRINNTVNSETRTSQVGNVSTVSNRVNQVDDSEMVFVPAGEFIMGSNLYEQKNPFPEHLVYLSAYWIYMFPVTVAQYRRFCESTRCKMPKHRPDWGWIDNHPIVNVTWHEAQAYCHWAGGELPTEAQWEKAARGTDGRNFPWGDSWDETRCANYKNSKRTDWSAKLEWIITRIGTPPRMIVTPRGTKPIGSHRTGGSSYGCHDMAGNGYEWCFDWYEGDYYRRIPTGGWVDPQGPETSRLRERSIRSFDSSHYYNVTDGLMIWTRHCQRPDSYLGSANGFRVVLTK